MSVEWTKLPSWLRQRLGEAAYWVCFGLLLLSMGLSLLALAEPGPSAGSMHRLGAGLVTVGVPLIVTAFALGLLHKHVMSLGPLFRSGVFRWSPFAWLATSLVGGSIYAFDLFGPAVAIGDEIIEPDPLLRFTRFGFFALAVCLAYGLVFAAGARASMRGRAARVSPSRLS